MVQLTVPNYSLWLCVKEFTMKYNKDDSLKDLRHQYVVASFASNDKQKNVMTWCKKETGVEE